MAYREVDMWEILEVLRRLQRGEPSAAIERGTGRTRKTIRRYRQRARQLGAHLDEPVTEPEDTAHASTATAHQRVYDALAAATAPLALAELRHACRIRTSTLCSILHALTAEGTIRKTAAGYAAVR